MKFKNKLKFLALIVSFLLCFSADIIAQNSTHTSKSEINTSIKTIDLVVEGMTCQKGCADGIDKKLKTVSGVIKSRTKLETGISTITFDENKVKVASLISIIEEKGYTAKIGIKNKKV